MTIPGVPGAATDPGSDLHAPRARGTLESTMPARGTRKQAGLTVSAFAVGITLPLWSWLAHGIPGPRRLPEERVAHGWPALPRDIEGLSTFARAFEDWFGDALGGRDTLLRWRSFEYVYLFGISSTPVAFIGKDAWVFLAEGGELAMQRGADPLDRFELEAWVTALRARQAFCRERGAEYVFALAPDKTRIYPERHPQALGRLGSSAADQLAAALAGDPVLCDLRPSQLRAKERDAPGDYTYYPHGTHWTDRGAAAGMRALGEHVLRLPRALHWRFLEDGDLVFGAQGMPGDSWAQRLYLDGWLRPAEPPIASILGWTPVALLSGGADSRIGGTMPDGAPLARVVFFHDSFGTAADPFIAASTARCVSLWGFFEPQPVIDDKPDLVVELCVERQLDRPPVENLPQQGAFARGLFAAGRSQFVMNMERDAPAVSARGDVEARLDAGALAIRWTQPTALALLPDGVLPPGAHAVVRLDVEVPETAEANFHFKTSGAAAYSRIQAFTRQLPAGRSEVFLHFSAPDIRGPLAFRINRPLVLRLHACESRLVD